MSWARAIYYIFHSYQRMPVKRRRPIQRQKKPIAIKPSAFSIQGLQMQASLI
jgi:hypothetical protein